MIKIIIFMFMVLIGINKSYGVLINGFGCREENSIETTEARKALLIRYGDLLGVDIKKYLNVMGDKVINSKQGDLYNLVNDDFFNLLEYITFSTYDLKTRMYYIKLIKDIYNIEIKEFASDLKQLNTVIKYGLGDKLLDRLNKQTELLNYGVTACRTLYKKLNKITRTHINNNSLVRETADYYINRREITDINWEDSNNYSFKIYSLLDKERYNFDIPLI